MPTLVEKQQERGALVEQMKKIQDKADAESRDFSSEEQQEFDRLDGEQDRMGSQIRREQRLAEIQGSLKSTGGEPGIRPLQPKDPRSGGPTGDTRRHDPRASEEYRRVFRNYLLEGPAVLAVLSQEQRNTLQMDDFQKGGALVPPEQFVAQLIQAVDDRVYIRQWATKYTVTGSAALGAPSLDTDVADADWTSELATGSVGTIGFGKRELRPHPLAKSVRVSNKLMRASAIEPERLVRDRLAYKFGVTEEKAFLTGDGVQKPLGVFTPSADGISTSRDVSTGNTATDIGADNLIEVKYGLKATYWPRANWVWSREAAKRIRKLKDGNGQYIWSPGLNGGTPDTILDIPYAVSEYVPAVFTSGLYVGILGDFSNYWIADALEMTVQRLVELYAATNETGFIGRIELDGAPVLEEAFARVKLG